MEAMRDTGTGHFVPIQMTTVLIFEKNYLGNESEDRDTQEDHGLFGYQITDTQHFIEVPGPLPHQR